MYSVHAILKFFRQKSAKIKYSSDISPMKTIPILRWKTTLERGPTGFGFGLRGGKDHKLPFYILRLANNGAAANSGELRIGDIVEEINATQTGELY